jgi:hypothetical protein
MPFLNQSVRDIAGLFNRGIKVGPVASTAYIAATPQTLFTITGGKVFVRLLMGTVTTLHASATQNISTATVPSVGSAVTLSSTVDTNALEAGGTLYVEGDGTATVKANGGVVLSSTTSTGGGFIVSTGTITFLPSATQAGATSWELWYWPIDDGASVS